MAATAAPFGHNARHTPILSECMNSGNRWGWRLAAGLKSSCASESRRDLGKYTADRWAKQCDCGNYRERDEQYDERVLNESLAPAGMLTRPEMAGRHLEALHAAYSDTDIVASNAAPTCSL